MKKETLMELLRDYDSFYLYDEEVIREHTRRLKKDLPGVEFLYSIKCNHHRLVVRSVFEEGFGADAASLGEVLLAREQGLEAENIYYSAPGKTEKDISAALGRCVLIADSISEVERIQKTAAAAGVTAKIGVRLNPGFGFGGGEGGSSKFGIDEDRAMAVLPEWMALSNVEVVGLHVHMRSQVLDAGLLGRYYESLFELAERFQTALGRPLAFLNMGSGIGLPYALTDTALDTAGLGERVRELMERFRSRLPGIRILIEVGRYAVGKSGVYVTKVVDKKVSRGVTYVVLKNTLNGFIRPSLARLVMSYAAEEKPKGSEPLFTAPDAFGFCPLTADEREEETVTLVGNLCTATDVMAQGVTLPRLEVGDGVAVTNAGSYAAVLSPTQFSGQTPPAALFLTVKGEILEGLEE